jgi:hypothetical protein
MRSARAAPPGQRAERDREAAHPGPHADRGRALFGISERVGENRQRGRVDHRRRHPHEAPGHDQRPDASGQPGEGREARERDQPELERALAPVPVAQASTHQKQRRERKRVPVNDPLQLAGRGVKPPADCSHEAAAVSGSGVAALETSALGQKQRRRSSVGPHVSRRSLLSFVRRARHDRLATSRSAAFRQSSRLAKVASGERESGGATARRSGDFGTALARRWSRWSRSAPPRRSRRPRWLLIRTS